MKRPLLLVFLTACTVEQGERPVVDAFTLPESATLDPDGTYKLTATVSFHDDDDPVTKLRVTIPSLGAGHDYTSLSGQRVENGSLAIQVAGTAPKGALTIAVTAIDREGNMSDPKSASVTLK
jgi:hypothetical protein